MNKDERFIEERFGKKCSFKAPENYFDDFASQLMPMLPEKENTRIVYMQSPFKRYFKMAALVAASVISVVLGINIYVGHERPTNSSAIEAKANKTVETEYTAFDEVANYSMIDNEDIYAYVSDN